MTRKATRADGQAADPPPTSGRTSSSSASRAVFGTATAPISAARKSSVSYDSARLCDDVRVYLTNAQVGVLQRVIDIVEFRQAFGKGESIVTEHAMCPPSQRTRLKLTAQRATSHDDQTRFPPGRALRLVVDQATGLGRNVFALPAERPPLTRAALSAVRDQRSGRADVRTCTMRWRRRCSTTRVASRGSRSSPCSSGMRSSIGTGHSNPGTAALPIFWSVATIHPSLSNRTLRSPPEPQAWPACRVRDSIA